MRIAPGWRTGQNRPMITAVATRTPVGDRWTAVAARSASADGAFVYAVTSTGIYCRPSCPSRRPRPDRVRFYETPDAAEAAGFRACRRCHPRDVRTAAESAVARARAWIDAHPDTRPSLDRLARLTGPTRAQLFPDERAARFPGPLQASVPWGRQSCAAW